MIYAACFASGLLLGISLMCFWWSKDLQDWRERRAYWCDAYKEVCDKQEELAAENRTLKANIIDTLRWMEKYK